MMTEHFSFQYLNRKVPVFQMQRNSWIAIVIIRLLYIITDPEHILMQNTCIFATISCTVSLLLKLVQAVILDYKF